MASVVGGGGVKVASVVGVRFFIFVPEGRHSMALNIGGDGVKMVSAVGGVEVKMASVDGGC